MAIGSKVYLTLSNLKRDEAAGSPTFGFYVLPAGHGKLAVVDAAADDAVTFHDLGAGCGNPGEPGAPGQHALDLLRGLRRGRPPAGGPLGRGAGGGRGGRHRPRSAGERGILRRHGLRDRSVTPATLLRFDPAGAAAPVQQTVCPDGPQGYAWASDVLCATRP